VKKKVSRWIIVAVYCILIYIGSSIPGDRLDTGPPGFDKILHVIEYLILSLLLLRACSVTLKSADPRTVMWLSVAGSALFGLSDEIHQLFVPLRQFDLVDIIGDSLGSLLGPYWLSRRAKYRGTGPFNP
jgi:VanZ family protein